MPVTGYVWPAYANQFSWSMLDVLLCTLKCRPRLVTGCKKLPRPYNARNIGVDSKYYCSSPDKMTACATTFDLTCNDLSACAL